MSLGRFIFGFGIGVIIQKKVQPIEKVVHTGLHKKRKRGSFSNDAVWGFVRYRI